MDIMGVLLNIGRIAEQGILINVFSLRAMVIPRGWMIAGGRSSSRFITSHRSHKAFHHVYVNIVVLEE